MILCCGDALIDMIPSPTQGGSHGFVPHPGGSVFNTAVALGRLGVPVGLLTGLSSDLFGRQLQQALKDNSVDTSHVVLSARPTTLAFVALVDGQASYEFYDENSAGRMLVPDDMPEPSSDIEAFFFGGISLACEPCADAYASFLDRVAGDYVVMLDPNIRPSFAKNEAIYRSRLNRMIERATILKTSDDDLNWLVPGNDPLSTKANVMLDKGPSLVLVTCGGDGATAYHRNGAKATVAAQAVDVTDTVGAGDTFNAGILTHLSEAGHLSQDGIAALTKDDLKGALGFGVRTAAITVSRQGADPPWRQEVS